MDDKIIICEEAAIAFKGFAMKAVNLSIPKGYFIGIQGDNGAGKSTLLKMITGKYPKMSGHIIVDGKDVVRERVAALAQMAVISEESRFFFEETIASNEKMFAPFYPDWNHESFIRRLKEIGISEKVKAGILSKGQNVLLQLAFAAAHTPKVILLDEPTAGLDPVAREEFLKHLQGFIAEYEATILMSTHLDEDISRVADYLIRVENGVCTMKEISEGEEDENELQ